MIQHSWFSSEVFLSNRYNPELEQNLKHIGLQAHVALGALDISREDIRLDRKGNPQLMEINPLPGLTLGYSDLCIQVTAEGIFYEEMILEILYLATGRWGLLD